LKVSGGQHVAGDGPTCDGDQASRSMTG